MPRQPRNSRLQCPFCNGEIEVMRPKSPKNTFRPFGVCMSCRIQFHLPDGDRRDIETVISCRARESTCGDCDNLVVNGELARCKLSGVVTWRDDSRCRGGFKAKGVGDGS